MALRNSSPFEYILLPLLLLVFAPGGTAQARGMFQEMDQEAVGGLLEGAWKIEALSIGYDHRERTYEAQGGVRIYSGDRSLRADRARLNVAEGVADLEGNVILQYGPDWLRGNRARWNIDSETGWVDGGMIFFSKGNFYVQGERIAKTGAYEYELENGYLTTCDPRKPDWLVRYKKARVNTEGVAWASHTSFWVRDKVPLFYFPFLAMPANRDRQSGLLLPKFALSDLHGPEFELPFYWAIRRDMDATLYGHYYYKRGFMGGIEYRMAHDLWGEGIWMFHYLSDRASKSHLEAQGYPFQQEDRYWLRGRHSMNLPGDVQGRLNVDFVSDKNFLKEFETGSVSYDHSDRVFRNFFGRGILNDRTINTRESNLYLNKQGESALLAMDVHYWDNLEATDDENTLQQLPRLLFEVAPDRVGDFPFYYSLDTEYVNYWRPQGDRGNRVDLYPRLHYPFHWGSYVNLEPSAGLRLTSYHVDWDEVDRDSARMQSLYDAQVLLSSRLNRVYRFGGENGLSIQHAIRPEILYEYLAPVHQDTVPEFDNLDDPPERHDVRYGISTFLTAKRNLLDADGDPYSHYHELGRLRVSQAYRIQREEIPDDPLLGSVDANDRFSDVRFELDVTPGRYLNLSYDTDYSVEDSLTTRHDVFLTLDSTRGHSLIFNYRFLRRAVIEELASLLSIDLTSKLSFNTYHNYSFDQQDMFRQTYGLSYQLGCWGISLDYQREREDQRVAVSLNLLGLGELGGGYSFGIGGDGGEESVLQPVASPASAGEVQ